MITINFNPFPVLETERLLLRRPEATDDKAIFAHRTDDIVNTHLDGFRHASIADTQAFIDRVQIEIMSGKTIFWAITEKGNNEFIGGICLWNIEAADDRAEIGYTLNAAFHRMGYISEALVTVLGFGFDIMGLKAIDAYTSYNNEGSIKLLCRNNFVQGTPRKAVSGNKIYFSLVKEE